MKKWIIGIFILIALIFCLPYLASIPPLKQLVLRMAEKKLDAKLNVTHLRLSWFGPQKANGVKFQTKDFNGTFDEINVNSPLWDIQKNFTLIGGHIQVPQSQASLENIDAQITGAQIQATGITRLSDQTGNFSIQGTMDTKDDFSFTFDMTQMPTAIADWFFKSNGMLQAAIGPNFNLKGTSFEKNGSGNIDLDLTTPTAKASLNAAVTPTAIVLQKPLDIMLNLTPKNSLLLTNNKAAVTGEDPITLRVSPTNCAMARPFALDKIKVCRGSLSLGRIRLQNADYLSGLSIFLKTDKLDTREVDAWIGKINFSLEDGKLDLARIDALFANSIHLCAWGQTNITNQTLNMILGVPADTLSRSFSIRNVSTRYVLQIPMTGTYKNPQLDTASATAKIAAIIAAGKVQKQGGILGGVATVLNQAAQEKAPSPVSPYPPFPWDVD